MDSPHPSPTNMMRTASASPARARRPTWNYTNQNSADISALYDPASAPYLPFQPRRATNSAASTMANLAPPTMIPRRQHAEALAAQLWAHYLQEEPAVQAFTLGMLQLKNNDAQLHAKFSAHLLNAAVISRAEVRTFDIALWYGKGLPGYVVVPLRNLSAYYHKEVRLQGDLAETERRAVESWGTEKLPMEASDTDHGFAYKRERSGKAPFGFETTSPGYARFEPRFEGRQQLKWVLAGLEARLVRLQFASLQERHGKLPWEADRNVDRKVSLWIEAARRHILFKAQGGQGGGFTDESAMAAFNLTATEKRDLLDDLLDRLKATRDSINARKSDVEELRKRRGICKRAIKALEAENEGQNIDNEEESDRIEQLSTEKEEQEEMMAQRYGSPESWDWEFGREGSGEGEIREG